MAPRTAIHRRLISAALRPSPDSYAGFFDGGFSAKPVMTAWNSDMETVSLFDRGFRRVRYDASYDPLSGRRRLFGRDRQSESGTRDHPCAIILECRGEEMIETDHGAEV